MKSVGYFPPSCFPFMVRFNYSGSFVFTSVASKHVNMLPVHDCSRSGTRILQAWQAFPFVISRSEFLAGRKYTNFVISILPTSQCIDSAIMLQGTMSVPGIDHVGHVLESLVGFRKEQVYLHSDELLGNHSLILLILNVLELGRCRQQFLDSSGDVAKP